VICSSLADGPKFSRTRCGVSRRGPDNFSKKLIPNQFLARLLSVLCLAVAAIGSPALTLEELRNDSDLTPERFMAYIRDFQFKLGEKRQSPEVFLETRTGDCDDFASLAAEILREKKFTTRLIAVFMDGQTHVVCYVEEIKGYLDYNRRAETSVIQPTNGKLEDMADKVAAWFRTAWRCVSEFTYQAGNRRFERVAFH
jgi:hypothetical protein